MSRRPLLLVAMLMVHGPSGLGPFECRSEVNPRQCEPQWHSWGGLPGVGGAVRALAWWDADGDGPMARQLVAAGDLHTAGGMPMSRLARWDGDQWVGFDSGVDGPVHALTIWDPDGDGPLPPQLIAGGSFIIAGGMLSRRVAAWIGTRWLSMGTGMNATVSALTTWDPDGDGPLPAQLIAGGTFTTADGMPSRRIALWDRTQWLPLGSGFDNGSVLALTTWDPDGDGPLPPQLIAGGSFRAAGGVPVDFIARWDGARWLPIGSGMDSAVSSLTTWDPDGDGPLPPQLVAGGSFTTAGGVSANYIARWNGSQWQALGTGMDGAVRALTTWDPDGEGPLPAQVVAGGEFTEAGGAAVGRIARWDGTRWSSFGAGMDRAVVALAACNGGGDDKQPPALVAGGEFTEAEGLTVNRVAQWTGTEWHPFGLGVVGVVGALTTWDPDGGGPLAPQLVAAGSIASAGRVVVNNIARWDGARWHPFGTGTSAQITALTTWDPVGGGPGTHQLVAAGSFRAAGEVEANRIARWDGTQWHALGTGLNGAVLALTTWDPDGDGPLPPQLVAGGGFSMAGDETANYIARWDGKRWHPLGTGVNYTVHALTTWDPDGEGPLPALLVAAGEFTVAGGTAASRIASWDGSEWRPLGTGVFDPSGAAIYALTTWDPDGSGPLPAQVVAGGIFSAAGGISANRIARWDGTQWRPFGTGMNAPVRALATWDPEGDPSRPARLAAGGSFTTAGGVFASRVATWDGTRWYLHGAGVNGNVFALAACDLDGAGPLPRRLVVGGGFMTAGGRLASSLASWGCGAPPPCPADFNGDGQVDFFDYLDFVQAFAAGDPSADFNGDGQVDFFDYLDFMRAFRDGCP